MGQRANYIIKDHDKLTIHYHHWRATSIAADLYLGEKKFLAFVEECQVYEQIMDEVWIEGCVIIDKTTKQLYFWALEFASETSVKEYYISGLPKKWSGWRVVFLKNRMYDAEKVLGIDYISKQPLPELNKWSIEDIIADKVEEWVNTIVILKQGDDVFVVQTGNIETETIVSFGEKIIPLLLAKPRCGLLKEDVDSTYSCAVIDVTAKRLILNESAFGLWEQTSDLWPGYEFMMGDVGYIGALKLAGINTSDLLMPQDEVIKTFSHIVEQRKPFDPFEFAKRLKAEDKDIQFNPDFFDVVAPRKTLLEKFKARVKKLFGK